MSHRLPSQMRVAVCTEPGRFRLETRPLPRPGPREALLRVRACGVCSGELMEWYVRPKLPRVLGHETAGELAALGAEVVGFELGDRVFVHHHAPCGDCRECRRGASVHCQTWRRNALEPGGLAEYALVSPEALERDTLRLGTLDWEAGTLVEPLACVVKALRRAGLAPGDQLAVLGVGTMGMLAICCARAWGAASTLALDLEPSRLERARRLGADACIDAREPEVVARVRELTAGRGAEVVFVAPPDTHALAQGLELAAPAGRVLMFSPPPPEARLELSPERLYFRELSLIPSYSCGPEDTREALRLLQQQRVPVEQLVTDRFPLEQTELAYRRAASVSGSLKVVVLV